MQNYLARTERSRWLDRQWDVAIRGGKPEKKPPDFGIPEPAKAPAYIDPDEGLPFKERMRRAKERQAAKKHLRTNDLNKLRQYGEVTKPQPA